MLPPAAVPRGQCSYVGFQGGRKELFNLLKECSLTVTSVAGDYNESKPTVGDVGRSFVSRLVFT